MPIIIETGTGDNADANTYAAEAQLTAYAADRGITLTGTPAELLLKAMNYTETQPYPGRKTSQDQPLQWPRSGVRIDGYRIPDDMIPGALITAQIVTAIAIDQGRDPLAPLEPAVKAEAVGPLSVEYQDGASSRAINIDVTRAFAKLLGAGSGLNQIPVRRA